MKPITLLVIDDEVEICNLFVKALSPTRYKVITAGVGEEGLRIIRKKAPQMVVLDLQLPGMNGLEVLRRIKAIDAGITVVILTAHGSAEAVVEAMRLGAYDFINKPFDLNSINILLNHAVEARLSRRDLSSSDKISESGYYTGAIIGQEPRMQDIYKTIGRIADSEATILVYGETGTGKELVAQTIHNSGRRAKGPFVTVDCVSLARSLLESELFGYNKGAFTGADSSRKGKIEAAIGGTLFLDEIGSLDLEIQAKLLRVIQEKKISRLGSTEVIDVDIRVITATNRDPEEALKKGILREDFYYRLNVIPIFVPPLRERREDIPLLVKHFLNLHSGDLNPKSISPQAQEALQQYNWPGNVRELQNVIERAVVTCPDPVITPSILFPVRADTQAAITPADEKKYSGRFRIEVDKFEKRLILEALEKNAWHQTKAAKELGISLRSIRHYIHKHGLKK